MLRLFLAFRVGKDFFKRLIIPIVGKSVGNLTFLCTLGENINRHNYYGKQYRNLPKINLSADTEIALLVTYSKEMKSGSWRDICIPMFIAALLKTTKM